MMWKNRYTKIKKGDWVKCVKNPYGRNSGEEINGGSGWKEDLVFKVSQISIGTKSHNYQNILWYNKNDYGVFEDYVEKIDKPTNNNVIASSCSR